MLKLCQTFFLLMAAIACATMKGTENSNVAAAVKQADEWDKTHPQGSATLTDYVSVVQKKIEAAWRHPKYSESRPATVSLDLELDREGKLLSVAIVESSDFDRLNSSALEAARKAAPYPSFPAGFEGDKLHLTVELILTAD